MISEPESGSPHRFRRVPLDARLEEHEMAIVEQFVWRVLAEAPASLVEAALFGSRARGEARPDSDIDILLVFRELPWDREPTATIAERLAEEIAEWSGVPLGSWTVSLGDLRPGARTPMLVDALEDAIPIWCWPEPLPPRSFGPEDALNCCAALLERLEEGSAEFADHLRAGDEIGALRRGRDDLVRASTGLLLLRGITRPRRGDAPASLLEAEGDADWLRQVSDALHWCIASFGASRHDEDLPVEPPAGGRQELTRAVEVLAGEMVRRMARLEESLGEPYSGAQFTDYGMSAW